MSDLRELYQEVILDHQRRPRNFRRLENSTQQLEGFNPLCGDRITVYLKVEDGVVKDIAFQGTGCAISTASASMMTESLKGKTREEALALFHSFHNLITGRATESDVHGGRLGKLEVFAGVREFPVRVKCASLAWHTMHGALEGQNDTVSTE